MVSARDSNLSGVGGVFHDLNPALEGGHLEQGQVGLADVVEVHRRVLPRVVIVLFTLELVLDQFDREHFALIVDALQQATESVGELV